MVKCLLCALDVDPPEFDEHMRCDTHMTKAFSKNIFSCDVCKTTMPGIQSYDAHLSGKPHARNLLKVSAQETIANIPSSSRNATIDSDFKIEYITKGELFVHREFSLTMVANVDLSTGYSPKMVIWDYGNSCGVQACDESRIFGNIFVRAPTVSVAVRNTMVITIPSQDLDSVKAIYGKGYAFHVMLVRNNDGFTSDKFFVVKYAQIDSCARIPKPIVSNQLHALNWFKKHLQGTGYKARSAALITGNTSDSVFRSQVMHNCNNKVLMLRQWSFNFEKEDGSIVLLDDPALVRVCEAIKREANIIDLLQMLIWIPEASDNSTKLTNIAQFLCSYKI